MANPTVWIDHAKLLFARTDTASSEPPEVLTLTLIMPFAADSDQVQGGNAMFAIFPVKPAERAGYSS